MATDSILPNDREREPADLNFKALSIFLTIVEEGSMAAAAGRLRLSPSGISQQISNLEAALGVRLFDRGARPIALTPAGTLLRHHADRILDAVGEARNELMELSLTSLPEFRVGIVDDLDASITPDLIASLQKAHPRSFITAMSGRSDHMTNAFLRRDLDIVVTAQPPQDTTTFDVFQILVEPFILVTARNLLKPNRPVVDQIAELPFVGYDGTMPLGRLVNQHFRRVGIKTRRRYSFDATRSVFAMVGKCRGWTVSTPLGAFDSPRFLADVDLSPLPFAGFSRRIYLANRTGELGTLPRRLAEQCRELIRQELLPRVGEIAPWAEPSFRIGEDRPTLSPDPIGEAASVPAE